jgi:hypothetical protein
MQNQELIAILQKFPDETSVFFKVEPLYEYKPVERVEFIAATNEYDVIVLSENRN